MPKVELKPITRPIDLGSYAPEYAGAVFQVWVNVPRAVIADYYRIVETIRMLTDSQDADRVEHLDDVGQQFIAWFSDLWSHGEISTNWSTEEVQQLVNHLMDTDPQAWHWLREQCLQTITDYRTGTRKN